MDTREYFMTILPVMLEYYLAALAERQREQPLHEIVAPSQQAVALVQDDELGLLPSLALQRTELQHVLFVQDSWPTQGRGLPARRKRSLRNGRSRGGWTGTLACWPLTCSGRNES